MDDIGIVRRDFLGGPLDGQTLHLNKNAQMYNHCDEETGEDHIYKLGVTSKNANIKFAIFVYAGLIGNMDRFRKEIKEPDRRLRIKRRSLGLYGKGKITPRTIHAYEVVRRYMKVIRRMHNKIRRLTRNLNMREQNVRDLEFRIDDRDNEIEYYVEETESIKRRAHEAICDMEFYMEENMPGYTAALPEMHEFEDYLTSDMDYEAYKAWASGEQKIESLRMKRERQERTAREFEEKRHTQKVRDKGSWNATDGDYWDEDDDDAKERKERYDNSIPF